MNHKQKPTKMQANNLPKIADPFNHNIEEKQSTYDK